MPALMATIRQIEGRNNDFDGVRRDRILTVEKITGRPLLIYATAFLNRAKVQASGGEVGIDGSDKLAIDEVISGLEKDKGLDVLLHSPGGEPEAAEAIVELLRHHFKSIRFIVPDQAKSAATMMCCAGDEILMDQRSALGPIDPQMLITRGDGQMVFAPAQAIIDQFDRAKEGLAKNPQHLPAWLPILQPLSPSLLTQCESADALARKLVASWLSRYMFGAKHDAAELAANAASFLADSKQHLSHARQISIGQLRSLQMNVTDLSEQPTLRDAVWDLYLAIFWTFDRTTAFKLVENGHGGAFVRHVVTHTVPISFGPPTPLGTPKPSDAGRVKKRKGR